MQTSRLYLLRRVLSVTLFATLLTSARSVSFALKNAEVSAAAPVPSFVVTTIADDASGVAANCTGGGTSNCTLRDALAASGAAGGAITFSAAAFGGTATITLGSAGSLVLPSNTSISGLTSGSGYTLTNLVTISGSGIGNTFLVNKGTSGAALANLILSNGNTGQGTGIVNNGGSLSLSNSTLSNYGNGAVVNAAGGSLAVAGCTFSNNGFFSSGSGTAMSNEGTATISDSTIYGNSNDDDNGSAVLNSGTLTVQSSTFYNNGSLSVSNTGTASFTNTLIDTCNGGDCPSSGENGNIYGYNIVGASGIGNYGGPTGTLPAPLQYPGNCTGVPTTLKTDQRGLPRSSQYGAVICYDSGAVQGHYALAFTTEPPASVPAGGNFSIGVEVEESGMPMGYGSLSLALAASDNGALDGSYLTYNGGTGEASGENVNVPGSGDTIVAGTQIVPGINLTTTSTPFNVTAATVSVTISTSSGLSYGVQPTFSVDNKQYTQPVTFTWAAGSAHTIATTSPQYADGCRIDEFRLWDDYGAISHVITASTNKTEYEAFFNFVASTPSNCLLTTAVTPPAAGTVTPATANYTYGTYVNLQATPKPGYVFDNWTGPVQEPTDTQTAVVVSDALTVTAIFHKLSTQTTYVVNTAADDVAGNPTGCATLKGTCTLRDALVGAAEAGSGMITFSPTVFAASQPASARTINLNAVLIIPSNTTITGPTTGSGAALIQLVTITPLNDTAFEVDAGTTGASISGLSISGGSFPHGVSYAEAVRNKGGVLSVSDSAITGNVIGYYGYDSGAVYNGPDGTLTLVNCNVSSNTSYEGFSGIGNSGTLVVTGSTIAGNTTQDAYGAGILNFGTATLTNTTVSGNQIYVHDNGGRGGGIYNSGTLNLVDSSVTGNSATNPGDGSGIYNAGTLHITNTTIVSNLTNYNMSYDFESFPPVEDDCDGPGCPPEPIPAPPIFTPPSGSYLYSANPTLSDSAPGTVFFYTTDGSTPTINSMLIAGEPISLGDSGVQIVKAIAFTNGVASPVATATYTFQSAACTLLDYSGGFSSGGLTLNGGATISRNLLQLTDGFLNEARSAFYSTPVPVNGFTTDFQFQILYPLADGLTFTIQSAGPDAVGQPGGGLGYAGIPKSVALKFDLFNNGGEGFNSTGYYLDGAYPSTPALDLSHYGIYLHSGHVFAAHIVFTGATTTATITDLATYQSYTATVPGDLTQVVGKTAYVGFTAGTSLLTAVQNILSWTYAGGSGCGVSSAIQK